MTRDFERLVIERLLDEGKINREDSILVVCGTKFEKGLFSTLGFSDVTITNLDAGLSAKTFLPYKWSVQDAQNLEFDNGQFDFTFVSNGLHHCRSPHRALLEMYWVSRKGVMAFESRDNLLIRLATLLNLAERYERSSVAGRRGSAGGADCLGIPNFVYRWTERDFEKTIRAFDPAGDPEFRFYHMPRLPKFPERSWKHLAGRQRMGIAIAHFRNQEPVQLPWNGCNKRRGVTCENNPSPARRKGTRNTLPAQFLMSAMAT